MATGYYLLDQRNPHTRGGFHGYTSRSSPVSAVVVHTAESAPSSSSATGVGNYFASTPTQVSYHTGVDSSRAVAYLPYSHTAFHTRGFNSRSLGLSFCTQARRWAHADHRSWGEAALAHGAAELAKMCGHYDIPIRRISAQQARQGVKGIVSHAQMDPSRRSDPGASFPWDQFFELARGKPVAAAWPLGRASAGAKVLEWQEMLLEWFGNKNVAALPEWGADGQFGDETVSWTQRWQQETDRTKSGQVGENDWRAMTDMLTDAGETATYDVAVVYLTDVDEGMAWVLGPVYRWKVLPGDHLHLVNEHALLVGSAQRLEQECIQRGIVPHVYAGPGRRDSGLAVAEKVREAERTPD